jgi:uncharacterized protein YcgI (DUF1989 family)
LLGCFIEEIMVEFKFSNDVILDHLFVTSRRKKMSDHTNAQILVDRIVPPGKPWSGIVKKGQILSIIDLKGRQAVDFLCYSAENPQERYNAPNTIKASKTLRQGE